MPFVLMVFFALKGNSQEITINGIVIDKETKQAIEDVHVAWERGQMILTNSNGEFSIHVTKLPIRLTLSHLSYGLTEINLDKEPADPFYIRLDPNVSRIDEVQISGERLRILTQHDDYSVIDFAFDDNYMWMLGYMNNQANRQRLFLANPYSDTICSIPVRRAEKLFNDAFENVHLVTRDSAYQLFTPGDSINLLYGSGRKIFDLTMEGILCGFDNKLVYKDYIPTRYNMSLYYLTAEDHHRHHLTYLIDTVGFMSAKQDRVRDAALRRWNIPELVNMWTTIRSGVKQGSKMASVVFPPIPMELFTYNDSLFILNFLKDSLLCYSPDGKYIRSAPVDFHKEERLFGIDYKELEFVTDLVTYKVYLTERRIARWILHPFDVETGNLLPEILLPDFAGMTGIKAHNNAIYFLYHEKLFPYFTRLYRYQL